MRIIELFAGIGACSVALKRIGIDLEIVDAVEIDKYAISSFNAIHNTKFVTQDIKKYNKQFNKIDLITHGSPCQDFSLAGKQAGGDIGSGTRSSLLYETIRIVEKNKPKYILWENVKNLLSKKHKHNFDSYIEIMNKLGYNSYYQVLNAKDYGIPQNRERIYTISIRKDIDTKSFKFPDKEELELRLKDMLEDEVEEKYYISENQMHNFIKNNNGNCNPSGRGMNGKVCLENIAPTLTTNKGEGIKINECIRIAGIFDTEKSKHQAGSVYNKNGLAPTLDTMQGGWRQPMIEVLGNYSPSGHDASRVVESKGLAPTVKENYGTVTTIVEDKILIKNATKEGHVEAFEGDSINLAYPNSKTRRGRVGKQVSQTLQCNENMGVVTQEMRIRKLTPKECWRLMRFL